MKKSGFTLVELMVVIIIIGILASVSTSTMSNMYIRGSLTEAAAALGTIKTAEKMYYMKYKKYLHVDYGYISNVPGIKAGDLQGVSFDEDSYSVDLKGGGSGFYAYCRIDTSSRPGCSWPSWWPYSYVYVRMDDSGTVQTHNIPGSGFPQY